ncbi:hypothetical protein SAMN05444339_11014 [Loktanella atrilutea]|uniref:Uncharacterized protein n=1 Tax=Loktanella atrilutea TaxID=366533 RepID=A0A1M5DJ97_LOKAT|nr:hypothetical protein [Loktanella atrilutea]SHF66975.1 hypothetical protein SAMN05444339_11014 [Loktanella atrilutea]
MSRLRIVADESAPQHQDRPNRRRMSRSDVSVRRVGNVLYLRQNEASDFKVWFAGAWAEFLRSQFANPEEVASAFTVRSSTAWTWWNGDNKASGDIVMRMAMEHPEVADWFRDQWARRCA